MASVAVRRSSLLIFVGIGAATAAAHIGNNFTPYLVGGLIDRFGFTPLEMGAWSMVETLAYAFALFILAPRVATLSARKLALASTVVVVASQLGSTLGSQYLPLLALRITTGVGYGLMNAALNLAAGQTDRPDRTISAGLAMQTLLFAAVNIGLPIVGAEYGYRGMFVALAALSLVLAPALLMLPDSGAAPVVVSDNKPRVRLDPNAIRVIAAMALFAFGSLAIWPFVERSARAVGLSTVEFGRYQSLATLLSAGSNMALVVLAARVQRSYATAGALLVTGVACAVLTTAGGPVVFAIALILYNAAWFVTYPMILGAAFAVDPSGQLSIRTTGTWLLAQSAGALGAGAIAQIFGNYGPIGPMGLVFCIVAIVVILPLVRRIDGATGRIRT
ncbi:MAG: transporter [Sphingomonadales bacterium]|nr:transporter [Sphingomonadales bacterium]